MSDSDILATPVDEGAMHPGVDATTPLIQGPGNARTAVARGRVRLSSAALDRIRERTLPKGDALASAQIAGILGAKQASKLIPMCEDVLLTGVDLDVEINDSDQTIDIRAYVKTAGLTGVGMEALTAVTVAALTIVDMCKSVDRAATITDIHLVAHTGGQSGLYRRSD
jgi:cyclic pyranopterin monophosphate synthase